MATDRRTKKELLEEISSLQARLAALEAEGTTPGVEPGQDTDSQGLFKTLAESAPIGILIIQGTKFVFVNLALIDHTGYTRAEVGGMNFWELLHPDFRELVK